MSDRPSKSDAHSERSFDEGTLLWVNLEGFPWWPARVIHESECNFASLNVAKIPPDQVLIMFFNDNNRFCLTDKEKTVPFQQDKNFKRFEKYKGKYRSSLLGAIREASAIYNGQHGDGKRSSPPSNLMGNSVNEVQLLTSPSSSHVRNPSPAPDRRRKPVRRNSVSLETGHRHESNGDDEKNTKRKDTRRSSDGIPPARGKPRGKRVRKTEDRLNPKEELHIQKADKVQKLHRKRSHSPVSDDDNKSDAANRAADRATKSEFRKKSVGRNSTRVDERGLEERPKRRRVEDDPYTNISFDDIGIPRRKTEDDHRTSSPKRGDDFEPNSNSRKDDTREERKVSRREERDPRRRKDSEVPHDDWKRNESVVNDNYHWGANNARKRSPREGLKEAQSNDDLNAFRGPERRPEKGRDKSDDRLKTTLLKSEPERSPGMLLASSSRGQIQKSSDVCVKGNSNQSSIDRMSDDENHPGVETVSCGREKNFSKSEDSGDDTIGMEKKGSDAAHQTSGTWDFERIADYVPDKSLTQPRSLLSQEQLLVLLAQRETELRRCRLQLWRADCKLKKDRLASSNEVGISLRYIEELVGDLVDWTCARPKRNQGEKQRTPDGNDSNVFDYSEHLLEDDKITFGEKVEKICEAAHDIRRVRFDPNKVDTKSLAERLFSAMQRAMKVSRRASFALKDMVSLWADIYMFSEIEKKQAVILSDEKGSSKPLKNRQEENDLALPDASDHENDADAVRKKVMRKKSDSDEVDAKARNNDRGSRTLSPRGDVGRGFRLNEVEKPKRHESKNPVESRRDTKLGVSHGKWSPCDDLEHTLLEVDKTGTNEMSSESAAHSVEEGQPNGKDMAKRQGGQKVETVSRPERIERPRSTLNGAVDKLSDPVEDSDHSTSGDEFNAKGLEQRHLDKDQGRRGLPKRNRSGTRKQCSDKQSADNSNRGYAGDTGLDGDSKAGKAALKCRKNGSNSGDDKGGVVLSKERQKALDKLRSQMRIVRTIPTMVSGDRGADMHAVLDMTEKLVFKRCANENASGYNQSINSVLRAIQQLARKCNGGNVAKLVEEDEVAAALKECFASVRNDLSTAVEEFLKLCLEQAQTVVEGNREPEK